MKKLTIGLDIGGTKIEGVLWDGKRVLRSGLLPTPKNIEGFTQTLRNLYRELSSGKNIKGIGIGMAGIVDRKNQSIVTSPNLKFLKGIKFATVFPGVKIVLENDANCFSLAEAVVGGGKKAKTLVGVTLGTGVGGGLVANKAIYPGAFGSAGEVGHFLYNKNLYIEDVFKKVRDKKSWKGLAEVLGVILTNVVNFLDPENIVLGGGVSKDAANFLSQAKAILRNKMLNTKAKPKIYVSKLNHAGAIGAALLIN